MGSPEREDLIEKLISHRDQLVTQVSALSEEEAATPPAPGEWSTKQQLTHMADAERLYTRAALRVCAEDEPDLSTEWSRPQAQTDETTRQYGQANSKSLPALLADLADARRGLLAAIDSIRDDQFSRTGRKTPFGDMTVIQLLRSLYRHDRMHIDQIAGRQSSYQPRWQ